MQSLHIQVGAVKVTKHAHVPVETPDHGPYCGLHLLTKFEGGLMTLHDAEDDTVNWAKFCGNYRTREITSLVPRLTT